MPPIAPPIPVCHFSLPAAAHTPIDTQMSAASARSQVRNLHGTRRAMHLLSSASELEFKSLPNCQCWLRCGRSRVRSASPGQIFPPQPAHEEEQKKERRRERSQPPTAPDAEVAAECGAGGAADEVSTWARRTPALRSWRAARPRPAALSSHGVRRSEFRVLERRCMCRSRRIHFDSHADPVECVRSSGARAAPELRMSGRGRR